MDDLSMEFKQSEGRVSIIARNRSLSFSGTGANQEHAVRSLENALRGQLGPNFDFQIHPDKQRVEIRPKP